MPYERNVGGIEEADIQIMVEVAPFQFVELEAAIRLGVYVPHGREIFQ